MEHLVTNPLNYFFASLVLVIALAAFTRLKWYWHLPLLTVVASTFFMLTPLGANFAVGLTMSEPAGSGCGASVAVILPDDLARAATHSRDYGAMSQDTLSRSHAAVEWLRQDPERTVVISGQHEHNGAPGAAKVTYHYLVMNGIAPQRLVYNAGTPSFYDGAVNLAGVLQSKDLLLIAPDIGFNRAKLAFEKQDFAVCPRQSEARPITGHPVLMALPSAESVAVTKAVLWEIVGLTWYWWTDRI